MTLQQLILYSETIIEFCYYIERGDGYDPSIKENIEELINRSHLSKKEKLNLCAHLDAVCEGLLEIQNELERQAKLKVEKYAREN